MSNRHFIIPDTQVKDGVPLQHFIWLGLAIAEYKPTRIIHLGDHWDCESISSHANQRELEGKRILHDVEAGNEALRIMCEAMGDFEPKSKHILRGNHEDRMLRFVSSNPVLEGVVSDKMFNNHNFTPVNYSNRSPGMVELDGIAYAHYFSNPNTGRAIGGNASYKLSQIGCSFVQGHVQGYDIGSRQYATGRVVRGIVSGSCYLHDEGYKGLANAHWRGAIILNEVEDGQFSEMPLTLDYLCKKYEGMSVSRFLQRKYRNAKSRFTLANGR